MNDRERGLWLVRKEVKEWAKAGWIVQPPLYRPQWIGTRMVPVHTDFFGRYDFMAAWPKHHLMVLVQVSAETEGGHAGPGPMGFCSDAYSDGVDVTEGLMAHPENFLHCVLEVYVYYRKLKPRNAWTADRRWWRKE